MDQEIIEYVRSCLECQKDKASCHKPYGLLSPLELPYAPWTSIAMDFITDLPLSEDCDQLWVIVDRFTKMGHFITLKKEQKTAEHLVKIFACEIWRFHWHSDRYHLGPRLPIHFDRMETIPRHPWGMTPNEYVFPSTDRWSDRTNQSNDRGIPTIIH
jgi:hypothetical protein